ncbi:MAG: hypothetical protein LiPW15_467 [Parcubacteria group bacterium LiPW_15]|nr:MAG: hypothetical protein LiPW15_467 [Parcubacteria group bacterium LiPW_15]
MLTGILLAELPPTRAEVLLIDLSHHLLINQAMTEKERLEILNSVFSDLHDRAHVYAKGWPDWFKKFRGVTT